MALAQVVQADPNMRLSVLSKDQALREWPLLSRLLSLADARSMGRYTAEDLRGDVEQGLVMIVIAWDPEAHSLYAAFAVQLDLYPRKKVFNIIHAGGVELERWVGLYPAMREIARSFGCQQIQIAGRPGWGRILRPYLKERGRIYAEDL